MKPILITKPFLPPKEDYDYYLSQIWDSHWLTNLGPLGNELEYKLALYLKVSKLLFVTNGTTALQMAIKALDLTGEIITTPFSFVATTSSIVWEGCQPVFADIDPYSLNIDPKKVEAAITSKTSAILATHVYGNPCDVVALEQIASRYNLKLIFDGAHSFDVKIEGKSIFEFGDISICSLHATKIYHSGEGGLIFCKDEILFRKLQSMRNFGIAGFGSFNHLGINAKNSEFHAAMGLANLKYIEEIHLKRKLITEVYDQGLKGLPLYKPQWHLKASLNFAYYPVIFKNQQILLKVRSHLLKNNIHTRRYFYPSLANALPYLEDHKMPVAEAIAERVLCLPLYFDLALEEVKYITNKIKEVFTRVDT